MMQIDLKPRTIVIVLLLVLNLSASGDSNSKTGINCISTASSTISLMSCYAELSELEDVKLQKKLNNLYQGYPKLSNKINQSYQHWLDYRESHCSLVYDAWGDGSAKQYAYPKCLYEMAKDWKNPMYINYK